MNYFRMASIHGKLKDLDSWVRNTAALCIWHPWNSIHDRVPSGRLVCSHHKNDITFRQERFVAEEGFSH